MCSFLPVRLPWSTMVNITMDLYHCIHAHGFRLSFRKDHFSFGRKPREVIHLLNIQFVPDVEARDQQKKLACLRMGITLITVPFWWDGELSSLATTVHRMRPDVSVPFIWLTSPISDAVPKHLHSCTSPSHLFYCCSSLQTKTRSLCSR